MHTLNHNRLYKTKNENLRDAARIRLVAGISTVAAFISIFFIIFL